jgi:predicted nucleic acid-binding protein
MAEMRVYLNNCAYNRPFDDQGQIRISLESQAKLYIQRLIMGKELQLVCSYMSVYENSENPNPEHRNSILNFFHNATEFIGIDKADIIESRAQALKEHNIKANDSIHLACAIEGKCGYFITTDDGILKKYHASDIHVCNPIDFLSEVNNA